MPSKEQVVAELAKRKKKTFRLEDNLFPQQLAFVRDPARFKIAVTSRRCGKTVACAWDLVSTALEHSHTVGLYITRSKANAKKIVWPELKRLNKQFELGGVFNEGTLSVRWANGSIIYCSGASDKTEIWNFRGLALKKVYIDECQSFPYYIEELINDVLAPALMDYAGTLCLIGTPGPVPVGFFYDCARSTTWSHHTWTFWDNPFIPLKSGMAHNGVFNEELARRGVPASHPSIQREWYGRWELDADSLVYQYKKEINDFDQLPKGEWTYVLGVDLGFNDADALAVLAWSASSPSTYLVEEQITRKQGISELVGQIEQLRARYTISKVVVDTGGLGKKIAEELSRRYSIGIVPADKQRKVEYIELMNDALRTGKLMARSKSTFAHDCMKVEWDLDKSTPDKKIISTRFHSDICEAVLYAWRDTYSYSYIAPKPQAKEGSKEWLDELEEKAFEHFTALEEADKNDPYKY